MTVITSPQSPERLISPPRPHSPVLVVGAASGMGRETCYALAQWGRPTIAWDIDGEGAMQTAQYCRERYGAPAVAAAIDLRDSGSLESAVQAAEAHFGSIGGLAYCAGVVAVTGVDNLATDEWGAVLDVNLRGFAILTRLLLPALRRHGSGSAIVAVASTNALKGSALVPAYCASKGGLVALARALADGVASDGIRVNVVCPGATDTALFRWMMDPLGGGAVEAARQATPMHRFAHPAEQARPIRFLLSDDASFITGATLVVDGGLLA